MSYIFRERVIILLRQNMTIGHQFSERHAFTSESRVSLLLRAM